MARLGRLSLLSALLVLAACGDDDEAPADPPPPVARIEGAAIADLGDLIFLDGATSTGPGKLTFAWSVETPAGTSFEPARPDERTLTFVPDAPGNWKATLVVKDGHGREASDALSVRVRAPEAP